jgi:hypothetical protein
MSVDEIYNNIISDEMLRMRILEENLEYPTL